MKKLFLRAQHWQIFTFLIVLPFFLILILMIAAFLVPENFYLFYFIFPISLVVFLGSLGWLWSIGSGLADKLPPGYNFNIKWYNFFAAVPAAYLTLIMIVVLSLAIVVPSNPFPLLQSPIAIIIIIPLHLLSIFAPFYLFYQNALIIKSIEMQYPVGLADAIGEFALFWIYPVGIWFLQPRINRIYDQENLNDDLDQHLVE